MDKPIATFRPDLLNALLPLFLKNLFFSSIFVAFLFGVYVLLSLFNILTFSNSVVIFWLIVLAAIIAFISVLSKLIYLATTTYSFYKTHVVSENVLFGRYSKSVTYSHIVNVTTNISIWDQLSGAGDIILHTAEDKEPDVSLLFIKDPKRIEKIIYSLIHKHK